MTSRWLGLAMLTAVSLLGQTRVAPEQIRSLAQVAGGGFHVRQGGTRITREQIVSSGVRFSRERLVSEDGYEWIERDVPVGEPYDRVTATLWGCFPGCCGATPIFDVTGSAEIHLYACGNNYEIGTPERVRCIDRTGPYATWLWNGEGFEER